MTKKLEAPVLLIAFNRPDTTKKVFDAIKKAKPSKIYISVDGPRNGNLKDKTNCDIVKKIVQNVDWECETHYRLLDENLGCGWGPTSAISWAFENEDRLIILEDDCVPSMPFFPYCDYLLNKYLNDTRIWLVSGRSHQQGSKYFKNKDYIFSHYGHTWGWATWKRCWDNFDISMNSLDCFIDEGGAINILASKEEGIFFNKLYSRLKSDKKLNSHAWDYQMGYTILKNNGLCIVPAKNLIKNIGYIGTHSSTKNNFHLMKSSDKYKINKEPLFVNINKDYEKLHFNTHIKKVFGQKPFFYRIIDRIIKIIGLK